jgi:hypothetical protein
MNTIDVHTASTVDFLTEGTFNKALAQNYGPGKLDIFLKKQSESLQDLMKKLKPLKLH